MQKIGLRQARRAAALCGVAAVMLGGCQYIGPASIVEGRPDYNDAIQMTSQQMGLANIVRVHNGEMPLVMDITQVNAPVTAQVTVSSNVAGIGGLSALANAGPPVTTSSTATSTTSTLSPRVVSSRTAGSNLTMMYQENPTITYAPLSGQALISQLAEPIPLRTITSLPSSYWPLSVTFELTISMITPNSTTGFAASNYFFELKSYGALAVWAFGMAEPKVGGADGKPEYTSESATVSPGSRDNSSKDSASSQGQILVLYLRPFNPAQPQAIKDLQSRIPAGAKYDYLRSGDYLVRRRVAELWIRLLEIYASVQGVAAVDAPVNPAPPTSSRGAHGAKIVVAKPPPAVTTAAALKTIEKELGDCEANDSARGEDSGCIQAIVSRMPKQISLRQYGSYFPIRASAKDAAPTPEAVAQNRLFSGPTVTTNSALGMLKSATEAGHGGGQIVFINPATYKAVINYAASEAGGVFHNPGVDAFYCLQLTGSGAPTEPASGTPCEAFYSDGQHALFDLLTTGNPGTGFKPFDLDDSSQTGPFRRESDVFDNRRLVLIIQSRNAPDTDFPDDSVFISYQHKGWWYYMLDRDLVSKRNFSLVCFLMSVMAVPSQSQAPVATYSVNR